MRDEGTCLLAFLLCAVSRRAAAETAPILFYFWTPHAVHARFDLAEVALPPCSEACYARAPVGGIDCDYPTDVLMKITWAGLDAYAPSAAAFLRNFNYSTEQQTELLARVDLDGKRA